MSSASSVIQKSLFRKLMDSPTGPKTVHFWAPFAKWSLVLAGLGDLQRPAENLSVSQNLSLMVTGLIWSRWCVVIIPKNYPLMAVNLFVFSTGAVQMGRIFNYRQSEEYKQQQNLLKATA